MFGVNVLIGDKARILSAKLLVCHLNVMIQKCHAYGSSFLSFFFFFNNCVQFDFVCLVSGMCIILMEHAINVFLSGLHLCYFSLEKFWWEKCPGKNVIQ